MKIFTIIKLFGRVLLEGVKTYLGLAWQGLQTLLRMSEREIVTEEAEYGNFREDDYEVRSSRGSYRNPYRDDYEDDYRETRREEKPKLTKNTDDRVMTIAFNTIVKSKYSKDILEVVERCGINRKNRNAIMKLMVHDDTYFDGKYYLTHIIRIFDWEVNVRFYNVNGVYYEVDEEHEINLN